MKLRALPWIIATICLLAFLAAFAELRRVRERLSEVSHHTFHDHAEVRQFMIRAALAEVDQPIVVIGDSITEMARLPQSICGHSVVNAGIGGMNISEASRLVPRLFEHRHPFMVVSALGANDVGSGVAGRDYAELLRTLGKSSTRLLSVSDTSDLETAKQIAFAATSADVPYIDPQLPVGSKLADGIHYSAAAYRIWIPAVQAEIEKQCGSVPANRETEARPSP
jgi:lysophospholipase L1-like esterase